MPTFNVEIVDDRIMVEATLSVPPDGPKSDPFTALVDTGAQATMISEKVANALGAASVGRRNIVSLGGEPVESPVYRLRISVGSSTSGTFSAWKELYVQLLPADPPNFDVLLGMDILASFHITMHDGYFTLRD